MRYHSPEPWRNGKRIDSIVCDGSNPCATTECAEQCDRAYGGRLVAETVGAEDRRRIIVCVNALAKFSTEGLETDVSIGRRIARIVWEDA